MRTRILGHIHTFNDSDVIEKSLQALRDQTYPLDEILIVDNASTDGTLDRAFPKGVTVIRHPDNRGTSGTVVTGFQYAMDHGYDWIWLFDADSAPRRDALEKLMDAYQRFSPALQKSVWLLASLHFDAATGEPRHGGQFSWHGGTPVHPASGEPIYQCDVAIWTGSLYRLEPVKHVGLPNPDYVLDMAEWEYGYRGKCSGYRAYTHQHSIVDHNIVGKPALHSTSYRVGPLAFSLREFPPIRCYYLTRNLLYFWLHQYRDGSVLRRAYLVSRVCYALTKFTLNFLVRPVSRRAELRACVRGLRDGFVGRLSRRY